MCSTCSIHLYSNHARKFGSFNPKYVWGTRKVSLVDVKNEEERPLNLGMTERTLSFVFLVRMTHKGFSYHL